MSVSAIRNSIPGVTFAYTPTTPPISAVLERQVGRDRVRFAPSDRMFLAALLHRLPTEVLRRTRLLVRPDTVLHWHRDLVSRRHTARSRPGVRVGRVPCARFRVLVLRLARENPRWGYRRTHGELLVVGVQMAASTVWEILKEAGIDPVPERGSSTWTDFCAPRVIPCWRVTSSKRPLCPGRSCTCSPRSSTAMERWAQTCQRELLNRTLVWNQHHLLHALRDFEQPYNSDRPHQGIADARPLHPLPPPITDPDAIAHPDIRRRDRLGGTLHEYQHAA